MFLTSMLDKPDNYICRFPRSIGYKLSEMIVICIFQLIFYDYFPIRAHFGCENINTKIAHRGFGFINGNL